MKNQPFRVTHRFHPLFDQEFDLVNYTVCWGEPRVFYYDQSAQLCSLPAAWTSVGPLDPAVEIGAGRSLFRVSDLLELSQLIREVHHGV